MPALLLPTAGKVYLINANVSAEIQLAGDHGYIATELYDASAGIRIPGTTRPVVSTQGGNPDFGSAAINIFYVPLFDNTSIQIYAGYSSTLVPAIANILTDVAVGETSLGYLQIN
jgi:hypothetical protein